MSSNIEVIRICEHCKTVHSQNNATRYCSHICNSRGYKSLVRKGKVESNNERAFKHRFGKIKPLEFLKITQATGFFESAEVRFTG
jgi:hypothetical protein